jgi:hypothetical protein
VPAPQRRNRPTARSALARANYWDVKSSKLVQLFAMAKAVVTGKPPTDLGEYGEVRMR